MKRIFKRLSSLLAAVTLLTALSAQAFAADITYKGNGLFSFNTTSQYTESDLFGNFKDVMPGDKRTEVITFKDADTESDFVDLYISARLHDEENGLTYSEKYENTDGKDQTNVDGERDETVASMNDFLSKLSLKVWKGTDTTAKPIYEAAPDVGLFVDGNQVWLGNFRGTEAAVLTVELTVPIDLGNEYAYRVGEVDWLFTVVPGEDDDPPPSPSPSESPTPSITPTPTPTPTTTPTPTPTPPTPSETPPQSGPLDITVKKVWKSGEDETTPAAVVVTLFDGETAVESVRLDASNSWTYTWKDVKLDGAWSVKETILPKGYTPSYSTSGNVVTITNTSTLIQTGQLNWPILVLGTAGLLLIVAGGAMLVKKKSGNA